MRFGVCCDIRCADIAARTGYDFIESPLHIIAGMEREEFRAAKQQLFDTGLRCEAMNAMLPPDIKVVGPHVNAQRIHDHIDTAFDRAKELGAEVVVISSAKSRQVPAGFDFPQAWRQLANFLRMVERHAREHELYAAIEPVRASECNLVNRLGEATAITSIINMPHIGVAANSYHMAMGGEGFGALTQTGGLLAHVHIADSMKREFPKEKDRVTYSDIFASLRLAGYNGRVSIEARTDDLEADAAESLELLRRL